MTTGVRWTTTGEASATDGAKILVYGPSGTGKTMLCATLPKPAIISAESGLLSLSRRNLERVHGVGNPDICYDIPVIQVASVAQLKDAFAYFANSRDARTYFSSIAIDSLSEIAEAILANARVSVKDNRLVYTEYMEKVRMTVKEFRDLAGYNILMTAKQELVKNEADGTTKYHPMMPGNKFGPDLPHYFDEVFPLKIGQVNGGASYRYLQTDGDLQYIAKDRSGMLDAIERPNLSYIIRKIKGV